MTTARPFRHLCPEADERDAMSDGEFWERVARNLGVNTMPEDLDDEAPDLDTQVAVEPCPVCGGSGACGYDQEGRALIHADGLCRRLAYMRAWLRMARSHRDCEYAPWPCSDGWFCGGCYREWNLDGRPTP